MTMAKENGRRSGMGTNMYPSSALLEQNNNETIVALPPLVIEDWGNRAGV
ncbi:hypothetical protein LguiB_010367 [Lonicera macranthoides]